MKIAFFSFYSGCINRGVEKWTSDLASRLSKSHEVCVIQNEEVQSVSKYNIYSAKLKVNWNKEDAKYSWQRYIFIDYWSLIIGLFTLKLLKKLWKEKFDVIIPTNGGWQSAIIRLYTWMRGGKMVIVGHSGMGWDDKNNLWCFPDYFVALSSKALKWAQHINPFVKSIYIPDGVDLHEFSQKGEKISINLKKPIILTVAALEKDKRIDLVISAASRIPEASLLIVGRGEEESFLRKICQEKLKGRYVIKSFKPSEMPKVYRSVDLLVLASKPYYSFEMVITEALSSNLAVVANNDDIRKEIVGEAGILTDVTNPKLLAKVIEKSLSRNWDERPRKQAERFSWDKVANQYEKLFNEITHKY